MFPNYFIDCNNTLAGYRGVIESLNFPNTYPKNQNCIWTITAPLGNKINISFSHFQLEQLTTKGCKFDYVEVNYFNQLTQNHIYFYKLINYF